MEISKTVNDSFNCQGDFDRIGIGTTTWALSSSLCSPSQSVQGDKVRQKCPMARDIGCVQVLGSDEQPRQVAHRLNHQHHCSACPPLSLSLHRGTSRNSTLQREVPKQLEKQL